MSFAHTPIRRAQTGTMATASERAVATATPGAGMLEQGQGIWASGVRAWRERWRASGLANLAVNTPEGGR